MSTFQLSLKHYPNDTVRVLTSRRVTLPDGTRKRRRTGRLELRVVDLRRLADALHDEADRIDRAAREGASESEEARSTSQSAGSGLPSPAGVPHRARAREEADRG